MRADRLTPYPVPLPLIEAALPHLIPPEILPASESCRGALYSFRRSRLTSKFPLLSPRILPPVGQMSKSPIMNAKNPAPIQYVQCCYQVESHLVGALTKSSTIEQPRLSPTYIMTTNAANPATAARPRRSVGTSLLPPMSKACQLCRVRSLSQDTIHIMTCWR